MTDITRRSFVSRVVGSAIATTTLVSASGGDAQLPPFPSLSLRDALLLRPGDTRFADYQVSAVSALETN
jgi:hypothetical protein